MGVPNALTETLILLGAMVCIVPIFKRIGLGSVLGYLVAGILIGPNVFNLLNNSDDLLEIAEFGIVMLMFMIGLELEPKRLWSLRHALFGMGLLQIILTWLFGFLVAYGLDWSWRASMVVGAILSVSSTALAIQTLHERRWDSLPGARSTIAVLLAQDIMIVPTMLILGALTPKHHSIETSLIVLDIFKKMGSVLGVVLAGYYLLRPLLQYIAQTSLREVFLACSLLLVVGSAWVMHAVEMSMALGAFLAGVLLAESEYRHQLELDIAPFKGLLLGLFFLATGMSVHLDIFIHKTTMVLGLILGVFITKFIICYALAWVFQVRGSGNSDAILFGFLLAQIGEFGFVLLALADENNLMRSAQLELIRAVTAGSLILTPLAAMLFNFWLHSRRAPPPKHTQIKPTGAVIIAGFGRFGGIVARLLHAKQIETTIIEYNSDQIELVRKFGYRAYYGDITRMDLLEASGASEARLIILALDDPSVTLRAVRLIQLHYPRLKILARARSRTDAYELIELGVPFIRDTFFSSLEMGKQALMALGLTEDSAQKAATQFRDYDESLLLELAAHRDDQKILVSRTQQARLDLERLLREDEEETKPV